MDATNEKQLVNALLRGDSTAQRTFLRQYAPHIFQLTVRMTSNEADAEELTQDTLLRALQRLSTYDPQQASLATWLARIAYRLTLNHLQHHQAATVPLDSLPAALLAEDSDNAPESAPVQERLVFGGSSAETDLLLRALDHLPPDELTLVNLFYYDDLPLKDIAYIIEAPPGTVATRLQKKKKKLYHLILKFQQQ